MRALSTAAALVELAFGDVGIPRIHRGVAFYQSLGVGQFDTGQLYSQPLVAIIELQQQITGTDRASASISTDVTRPEVSA
ncbi:MAG: hypothetical protein CM15mP74_05990 [Halieaceae bacterium]|nr:MAG: hypothetical protein CM15mP74_05990 [Halieaceae bacterium]